MKGVFVHKPHSRYDDVKGKQYHFPKRYLSKVEKTVGDWVVYYEPIFGEKGLFYTGCGRVAGVRPDANQHGHYYADISDYLDFDRNVPYRENRGYESKLVDADGRVNGGTAQNSVRLIEEHEFTRIVDAGLSQEPDWPDRDEDHADKYDDPTSGSITGLYDAGHGQPTIIDAPYKRRTVDQLISRKWRDRKFAQNVRVAYDRTCAFTGLRLINGKGRPEVQAAHIRPIKDGGNDWVRNGIALSGTVHWMFDRGMLSLDDDYSIIVSRQLNYDVSHLLNADMRAKVPSNVGARPHPLYLGWHRQHVFKN